MFTVLYWQNSDKIAKYDSLRGKQTKETKMEGYELHPNQGRSNVSLCHLMLL
jgi:hypothetical protein